MTILLIAFILIMCAFLMYLINPKDIFKINRTIQEKKSRFSSIDNNSNDIMRILKDQPLESLPENVDLLVTKFELCDKRLRRSESSLYCFFGFTSRIISVSLSRSLESFSFQDEVYGKFCDDLDKFIKSIENKDFTTFYECIANFLYLSSIQQLPTPRSQEIMECIKRINSYIEKFPVYVPMNLGIDILRNINPKLYMFIRHIENANSYFYDYAQLQGYEPKMIKEEQRIIKSLFNTFIKNYEKDNIHEQFRIVRQLSEESEKVTDILLPRRVYIYPIDVYAKRACAEIETSSTITPNVKKNNRILPQITFR